MLAVALCVHGCGTTGLAPVDSRDTRPAPAAQAAKSRAAAPREGRHVVAPGDTLYAIAFRYGLDYRDLARWNSIDDPYVIVPGRSIRLTSPSAAGEPKRVPPGVPRVTEPARPAVQPGPTSQGATQDPALPARLNWRWPAMGRVHRSGLPTAKKGVDISGRKGQPIVAAAPGVVVYSGSGLLGYGQLIIIKHSDTFLSAYAYNERLLVQEGDRVAEGQEIATMGLGNDGRPVLHFQIRKDGKPVNPLDYLPKHSS